MQLLGSSVRWICAFGLASPLVLTAQTSLQLQTNAPLTQQRSALSGNAFLSPDLLALQNDASRNPTQLWVDQGQEIWGSPEKKGACFECHNKPNELKNSAPQFPKWSVEKQHLINLEDQILSCAQRTGRPFKGLEDPNVMALSALLHQASQGQSLAVKPTPGYEAQWQAALNEGAKEFTTRLGRMNLACTHCHDQNIGKQMRADIISPGHPTGFPIFKMSWQSMGSIDRRLRACYSGVQAEVPTPGSPVLRQLELFLKMRAQGMPMDGPSLRR